MDRYLDMAEAAIYLKCSKSFLYKAVCLKKIPHIKMGARTLFNPAALDEWLDSRRVDPIKIK